MAAISTYIPPVATRSAPRFQLSEDTCVFAAMEFFRKRLAQGPTQFDERLNLTKREVIVDGQRNFSLAKCDGNASLTNFLQRIDAETIQSPATQEWISLLEQNNPQGLIEAALDALSTPRTGFKNLYDFVTFTRIGFYPLFEKLLTDLGYDYSEIYKNYVTEYSPPDVMGREYDQLRSFEKFACLQFFILSISASRCGMTASSWNPHESIDTLIETLEKGGPLLVWRYT